MSFRAAFVAATVTLAAFTSVAAAPPFEHLHAYPLEFWPYALNNAGQVVGVANGRAFISGPKGKGRTPLKSLGLYIIPYDINDDGVVVGHSNGKAFITDPGGSNLREIAIPWPSVNTKAVAINRAGQVVGNFYYPSQSADRDYDYFSFITDPGGVNPRLIEGYDPLNTVVHAINNLGQVTGDSGGYNSSPYKAFVTGPNGVGLTEVNHEGPERLAVNGINDAGQIAGRAYRLDAPGENTFVGAPGQPIQIKPTLGGKEARFSSINAQGDQVGWSTLQRGGRYRAYVATFDGDPVRVDKMVVGRQPGEYYTSASDINDRRQIVVAGEDGGYILCPTENCE